MATTAMPAQIAISNLLSSPEYRMPEGNSQTFKKFQLLNLSSSLIVKASDGASNIAGIALVDGVNNTANALTPFEKIVPGTLIEMSVYSATPSLAVTALAQLGDVFGIKEVAVGSTYVHAVDLDETSNTTVKVVQLVDPAGTSYGRVLVQVKDGQYIFNS